MAQVPADQINDVMELCSRVSQHHQLEAAGKNVLKGVTVTGGGALLFGSLFGPPGFLLGGGLGGLLGWWLTSGQFKPISKIIMELPPQQRQKLYYAVMAVLGSLVWRNITHLVAQVMENPTLDQGVIAAILSYFKKELNVEVQCRN